MDYYLDAWRHFAVFEGRSSRKQFWMFTLVNISISIALSIVGSVVSGLELLSGLYGIAVLIPAIAISVRRLHDIDKTGWWILLSLVPLIGGLILLFFFIRKGNETANVFGAPGFEGESRTTSTGETVREAEVVSSAQKTADDELLKEDLEEK